MTPIKSLSLLLALALLGGCAGYRLGPTAPVKSVRIDLFENKPLEPRLVVAVQRALKHRLQQDGYTIESDNSADLVVTGEIIEFLRNGISYQPGDVLTVQDYSLQLRAKLTVTERITGEAVINQDITGSTTVRVGNDFNAGQRQAVPLIADELAVQATDLITTGDWPGQ